MAKKPNGGVPRGRQSLNRHDAKRATLHGGRRGGKQSKQQVEQTLAGPLKKQPRPRPLPGMENARIRGLDDICTSIAETREQMNGLRAEETGLESNALKLMRKHQKTSWRHAGVELVRVPGEEKLRVRTARERTATAESEEEPDVEPHTEPEDAPDLEDTVIGADEGAEA
ncbi:MAG TPA: hypothetical protein VKR23_16025 [Gaiellaceae bacterium]|nr:hypothetical protein [Gaiellaceae bacterium]